MDNVSLWCTIACCASKVDHHIALPVGQTASLQLSQKEEEFAGAQHSCTVADQSLNVAAWGP